MSLEEKREMLKDYMFMTSEERDLLHGDLYKDAEFTTAMQMGYIALNSIDKLEDIAKKLIGTVVGMELDEILDKFHDFEWNEMVWRKFYLMFNDNNERHCENSFLNNNFKTEEELRNSNREWVEEILKHTSIKEIVKMMPEARFFMTTEQVLTAYIKGE